MRCSDGAPDLARSVAFAREARRSRKAEGSTSAAWFSRPRTRAIAVLGLLALASTAIAGFSAIREHEAFRSAFLDAAADVPAARIQEVDVMRELMLALLVSTPMLSTTAVMATGDNLVAGGDFEAVPQGSAGTDCFSSLLPGVPGWNSNVGYRVDRLRNDESCEFCFFSMNPTGGVYYISLQGSVCCGCNNNGWIEQTVPTIAGRHYRLRFDAQFDISDSLRVTCGNETRVYSGGKISDWQSYEIEFDATSVTTIRFASESPTTSTPDGCNVCWEAQGCHLDNISLIEIACPGDVVANGIVDGVDLAALLSVWGTDGGIYPRADTNGDGDVTGADLATLLSSWGACN